MPEILRAPGVARRKSPRADPASDAVPIIKLPALVQCAPEPPMGVGRFHQLWLDHMRRRITIRNSRPPGDLTDMDLQALREGEDTCQRLAALWTAFGYAVTE